MAEKMEAVPIITDPYDNIEMHKRERRCLTIILVGLFSFLLVYINCTKQFHCDISIHVYNVL
jgi:hypothetical protein